MEQNIILTHCTPYLKSCHHTKPPNIQPQNALYFTVNIIPLATSIPVNSTSRINHLQVLNNISNTKKATHFNDHRTATKILQCQYAHEAKTLSHNIENYNAETWKQIAKETCTPGIKAKFIQNPLLLDFLHTTKPLKLAEGTYDRL